MKYIVGTLLILIGIVLGFGWLLAVTMAGRSIDIRPELTGPLLAFVVPAALGLACFFWR